MSMPEFPATSQTLTRENAINQIISSIAMEELALSHIINAEGEKLQYVLGTIPGSTGPQPTIEQVLQVNESVRGVLQSAAETQAALRSKLQTALAASTMQGPTGPTGPTGATGPTDTVGFQATMVDAIPQVNPNENFVYNRVFFQSSTTDISYDETTGIFTVNQDGTHDFYVVTFWFYADGYNGDPPFTVSLFVDDVQYSTLNIPYTERQINSTAMFSTGADPVQIRVTNTSAGEIGLPATGAQSKIAIMGYRS